MWKLVELEEGKSYCLALCQDYTNKRYCHIIEADSDAPYQIRKTVAIPQKLLQSRASRQIAEEFLLSTGQKFVFGSHGEWFTKEELDALDDNGFQAVPWVSGAIPKLPSK